MKASITKRHNFNAAILTFVLLTSSFVFANQLKDNPNPSLASQNGNSSEAVDGEPQNFANLRDGKWSASYFAFATAKTQQLDDSKPSLFVYNFVGVNRKLDDQTKLSLRVPFTWTTEGKDNDGKKMDEKWTLSNVHVVYSMNRIISTQEWELSGNGRVYLPTSESAQMSRTMASTRVELYLKRYFGSDWNVGFVSKPEYFFQRQKAYLDDSTAISKIKSNKQFECENYFSGEIPLKRSVNALGKLGFKDEWSYGSEANDRDPRHVTQALIGVGAQWFVNRSMNFIFQVENQTEVSKSHAGLLRDENNNLQVFANLSI
jgi:hypothetical protein